MDQKYIDLIFEELVAELTDDLGEEFTRHEVESYVADAIDDLLGSISREALPEMASRLVRCRLAN